MKNSFGLLSGVLVATILTANCGRIPSSWSENTISANDTRTGVVYVQDSRHEVAEIQSPQTLKMARATVALVANENITLDKDYAILKGARLRDQFNLCSDQRYAHQQSIANCTGVLVSPRHILTAGHCLSAETCSQYKILFDFRQDKPFYSSGAEEYPLPRSSLYFCKRVLSRTSEMDWGLPDYSLVELDRPVTDRAPVEITNMPLTQVKGLYTLGFPSGVSMKYAHGQWRRDLTPNTFVAAIDTFAGNSGSPVFDEKTHALLGLVSGGEEDLIYDRDRGCNRIQVCKARECTGERIFKVGVLADLIRKLH